MILTLRERAPLQIRDATAPVGRKGEKYPVNNQEAKNLVTRTSFSSVPSFLPSFVIIHYIASFSAIVREGDVATTFKTDFYLGKHKREHAALSKNVLETSTLKVARHMNDTNTENICQCILTTSSLQAIKRP